MDATQRAAFAERIAREPLLAREIAAWGEHLSPMLDEVVPVVPPSICGIGCAPAPAFL